MNPAAHDAPPKARRTYREGRPVDRSNPLAELLGSSARAQILRVLFGMIAEETYLAEIVRRSGLAHQGVDDQLRVLLALEIVTSRTDRSRRYYSANTAHPFYPELRNLVIKSIGLRDVIADSLRSPKIEVAFVFGSVARGETRAESDVDLMIFGVGLREVASMIRPLHDQLCREVNTICYTTDELRRRLAENDHFLHRVLAEPKLFVVGDETKLCAVLEAVRKGDVHGGEGI